MVAKKKEQNWLDMVPVVKNTIGTIIHEDGLISISMPRFNKAWMAKLFLPKNKSNEIKINFEENGTAVWKQIDGKKSVREILNSLIEIGEGEDDYSERVILFLQSLYRNGFITL